MPAEGKEEEKSHVVTHIIFTLRKPVSAALLEEILMERVLSLN